MNGSVHPSATGWQFVINFRANIYVTIDCSTVLPLVLGVVTRQKPQSMGLWYWELMSRPDPAVLPVGTLHFLVGWLICPGGHVSSLNKSNPIHFLEWFWISRRILIHSHHNTFVFFPKTSVRPSVCHTFFTMFPSSYHHEIFRSYYQWQKWCPCKRSRSKVKVTGQNPI